MIQDSFRGYNCLRRSLFLHMKIIKFICLAILAAGCSSVNEPAHDVPANDAVTASVVVEDFIMCDNVKSMSEDGFTFSFKAGDKIGIVPFTRDGNNSHTSQLPLNITEGEGSTAAKFTTGAGWSLISDGKYGYVAYYPYSKDYMTEGIYIDFTSQEQLENGSTEHLSKYDYLYSDAVTPISSSAANFRLKHLCALAKFVVNVPKEYAASKIKSMSISADDNVFVGKGIFNIAGIKNNEKPSFGEEEYSKVLSLKMDDIVSNDGKIVAYMMMYPASLGGKDIDVKIWTENNKALSGKIHCEYDQQKGVIYDYDVDVVPADTPNILPDKPEDGETLNILLVGHSFGVDATEYLPSLLVNAGIDNVNIGRFYYPNCDLARHYDYFVNETPYTFYYCSAGDTKYTASYKTLKSVVEQKWWDIVVFQQSINTTGAGTYSTYQPYLNNLIKGVQDISIKNYGMVPFIGWHMFWGYDGGYDNMVSKIREATKEMMSETGIKIIIPSGTAVDIARNTSYNSDGTEIKLVNEIYGDGFHCSRGVGRYLGSCTWFESIIQPLYGVSVVGNKFRMTEMMSGESDAPEGRKFFPVNDDNALILQKCAAEAVKNPFGE